MPNDDYILRSDVLDFLQIIPIDLGYREIDDVEQYVKNAPAADVEPVRRGRWIDHTKPDENNTVYCWCSECGAGDSHHVDIEVPYCWKCGALMKDSTRGDLVGDILTKILSDYSAKIEDEKDNAEKL